MISDAEAALDAEEGLLTVSADVRNTGDRAGSHVVQVYASRPSSSSRGTERVLVDFARVELEAEAVHHVRLSIPLVRLSRREAPGRWVLPPGELLVEVASHAGDADAASVNVSAP